MFEPVYAVWALLPIAFVCITVWTKLKPVFGIHGREAAAPYFRVAIFTAVSLAIAIFIDQRLAGEDGSYATFTGTESEALILHWTLYAAVLLVMAYANKLLNQLLGKEIKPNHREGLARYQR